MKIIVMFVSLILFSIALGFLLCYPMMLLWNECLVPAIPAIREVTWLQMWGISIMTSLLFKIHIPK